MADSWIEYQLPSGLKAYLCYSVRKKCLKYSGYL